MKYRYCSLANTKFYDDERKQFTTWQIFHIEMKKKVKPVKVLPPTDRVKVVSWNRIDAVICNVLTSVPSNFLVNRQGPQFSQKHPSPKM